MPPDIIKQQQEVARHEMFDVIGSGTAEERLERVVATLIANIGRELEARIDHANGFTSHDISKMEATKIIRSITGISPTR